MCSLSFPTYSVAYDWWEAFMAWGIGLKDIKQLAQVSFAFLHHHQ